MRKKKEMVWACFKNGLKVKCEVGSPVYLNCIKFKGEIVKDLKYHRRVKMNIPNKETVEYIRKKYPEGTRVELISMNDPYTKLVPGDKGSVRCVDDTATIFVDWDTGSGLGVVYGEDHIKIIK